MNLPNKLTVMRICLVPVIVIVFLAMDPTQNVIEPVSGLCRRDVIVFLLFGIASLTDLLDGKIARSRNLITTFGKFADPIADKMLVNTMLILMVYTHQVNVVAAWIMISRDLVVDGLRMVASQHGRVVSAGIYGKMKTVLQMCALIFLILRNWPFAYLGLPVDQILLWAATVMSAYSGYVYFMKLRKYVLESM
ncbi:CDP-diacylglycerol--glycerol-3-phosphate 3-phosphatidyltransferase [Catenisphaera adipataccumulans]|uniref:CDP-diacylglycerol--glycerol-3-phosphate 3-phosphatidyltransferase n=1 Tax=Catenisphaera adipataccumulans TaxID=700500 RepID=A0A7W8CVB7_9FIRM|nr:CDP-diacylglycerol--glycerol-3-phosphate 3-phosphatidyltransferase [Catenisphaera adipataccumulans]MBB5182271.1 CDP-diacylglycerol--glycerol-3-phosphate 3-phosphatidyltransferase [Catenisphaera adipataccumulans]